MSHDKRDSMLHNDQRRAWTEVIKRFGSLGRVVNKEYERRSGRSDHSLDPSGEVLTLSVRDGEVVSEPFSRIWQVLYRTVIGKDGSVDIFSRASFTKKGRVLITIDQGFEERKDMMRDDTPPLLIARPDPEIAGDKRKAEMIGDYLAERPEFSDTLYLDSILTMPKLDRGDMRLGERSAKLAPHALLDGLRAFDRAHNLSRRRSPML